MRLAPYVVAALATLAASAPALAQAAFPVQRGNVSLDGSASFSSTRVGDSDRITVASVSPSALFFVADGLAVGATVSLARVSGGGDPQTSYGIGPSAAYFFGGPDRRVYPFVGAGASFSRLSDDLTALGGEVTGGAVFMLSRTVGLSGEAFYQSQSYSRDGAAVFGGEESFGVDEFGVRAGIVAFLR